jgi:hypothetical protein
MSADNIIMAAGSGTGVAPTTVDADQYYDNVSLLINGEAELDQYFANVSLLLDGNTLTDKSNNKLTVTPNGDAKVLSSNKKFGTGSIFFDGTGDYLTIPASSAIDFSGAYTIEFWMYPTAYPANSFARILMHNVNNTPSSLSFAFTSTGLIDSGLGYTATGIQSSTAVPLNTWTHVAFSITGTNGTARLFLNGALSATVTGFSSETQNVNPLYIGVDPSLSSLPQYFSYYTGYLDDLRITKGVARYTAAFTPPVKALPTQEILDNSLYKSPITAYGNASITSISKKYGNTAISFDGAGDYLQLNDSAVLELSNSDVTVEFWVNTTSSTQYATLISRTPVSFATGCWTVLINFTSSTSGDISFFCGDYSLSTYLLLTSGVSIRDSNWHHIALVRSNSNWSIYIDGISRANNTWSGTVSDLSAGPRVGNDAYYGRDFQGYIDDLRITKGIARYLSNFIPPTKTLPTIPVPITADPWFGNVSLLLNGDTTDSDTYWQNVSLMLTGDDFIDWSNQHNAITVVNNTAINTAIKKFNSGSMYFDGSGDYLSIAANASLNLSSLNFTIEYWIRPTAASVVSTDGEIVINPATSGIAHYYNYANKQLVLGQSNVAAYFNSTVNSVPLDTWTHVALVRSGNVFTFYINGQSNATYTGALTFTDGTIQIGAYTATQYMFNGYLTDLRITKGVARTITVPTAALPAFKIKDKTPNNLTITPYGNVQLSTDVIKNGTGSMFFDGTGDYLSIPYNSIFDFGTGDFTVEAWVNPVALTTTPNNYLPLIESRTAVNGTAFTFGIFNGKLDTYYGNSGGRYTATSNSVVVNKWQHIAIVRQAGVIMSFVNGIKDSTTAAYSGSYLVQGSVILIGKIYDGDIFNGYIDDFRITKGVCRYTVNFTPPSQSFPTQYISTGYDSNFSDVSLLLTGEGTNGSQAITDLSNTPKTITVNGNAQITTTVKKYGTGSMYFDGTTDYLTIPDSSQLQITSGNFTIELWSYPLTGKSVPCLFSNYNSTTWNAGTGVGLYVGHAGISDTTHYKLAWNGVWPKLTSSATIVFNAWTHIALVKNGSTVTLYLNGIADSSFTDSSSSYTAPMWWIGTGGYTPNNSDEFKGYIDDFRITKGIARYAANFTPPTYALATTTGTPVDSSRTNVSLLLRGNGTNGSTSIIDESLNNLTITNTGSVTANTLIKKYGTGSMAFSGSNYLTFPSSQVLNFGTSNFTIEMWHYSLYSSWPTYSVLIDTRTSDSFSEILIGIFNGQLDIVYASSSRVTGGTVTLNSWNHFAFVRNGTSLVIYLNGVNVGSATISSSLLINPANSNCYIGIGNALNWPIYGYMDDLRITKGIARYTASFTPPTYETPIVTADPVDYNFSQVSLLLKGDGSEGSQVFTDSSSNRKSVTVTGQTKVNTNVKKFGTGSIFFDGSGDYLTAQNSSDFTFGTGDFTIEGWYYFIDGTTNAHRVMWSNYSSWSTNAIFYGKHLNYTGNVALWVNNYSASQALLYDPNPPTNSTWIHYAVTRSGNTVRLFRDGVSVASATLGSTIDFTGTNDRCIIGMGDSIDIPFYGYMDDIRITKGVARYTASFAPQPYESSILPVITLSDYFASNTTLLLSGDNKVTGNTLITDLSTTPKTITNGNGVSINNSVKQYGTGSLYFNSASSQYLLLGTGDSNYNFGSGDFTIETWFNVPSLPSAYTRIFTTFDGVIADPLTHEGPLIEISNTNKLTSVFAFADGTFTNLSGATTITANVWNHVALVRQGTTLKMYLNGVSDGSITVSGAHYWNSNIKAIIGAWYLNGSYTRFFNGYLDDFRITKGVARYTGTFTPSTSSLASQYVSVPVGQQVYITPGTYSWVVPDGVTLISAVAVGGGGGGRSSSEYIAATSGGNSSFGSWIIAGGGAAGYSNSGSSGQLSVGGIVIAGTGTNGGTDASKTDGYNGSGTYGGSGGGGAGLLTGVTGTVGHSDNWNAQGGTGASITSYSEGVTGTLGASNIGGIGGKYGGGGGAGRDGNGGGGGAIAYGNIAVTPGQIIPIVVGAGGVGTNNAADSGRSGGYGASGAVRIIWGPGRSYPLSSIGDM